MDAVGLNYRLPLLTAFCQEPVVEKMELLLSPEPGKSPQP